jgi:hypothetical protein
MKTVIGASSWSQAGGIQGAGRRYRWEGRKEGISDNRAGIRVYESPLKVLT